MSLLSLPTELHLAIAQHLPWWDIYALRFTCRLMNSLLPSLKQYHHLPSLSLTFHCQRGIHNYTSSWQDIYRPHDRPAIPPFSITYHPTLPTSQLLNSFYLKTQNSFLCLGCGTLKSSSFWFSWHENPARRSSSKGSPWRAWQRCQACDEALGEWIPQRCVKHEKARRGHVCRGCGPSMVRVGRREGERKEEGKGRKRSLEWL